MVSNLQKQNNMKKWYAEEYSFEMEVTGFLRGNKTERYCFYAIFPIPGLTQIIGYFIQPRVSFYI